MEAVSPYSLEAQCSATILSDAHVHQTCKDAGERSVKGGSLRVTLELVWFMFLSGSWFIIFEICVLDFILVIFPPLEVILSHVCKPGFILSTSLWSRISESWFPKRKYSCQIANHHCLAGRDGYNCLPPSSSIAECWNSTWGL